jgi:hypothetical protein
MPKPLTLERFLQRACEIHGEKYDYAAVTDVSNGVRGRVDIRCKGCGSTFNQKIHNHFLGNGCPACADSSPMSYERRRELFFKRAHEKHGEKYDWEQNPKFKRCVELEPSKNASNQSYGSI